MATFKLGIIADWLRLPFRESLEACAKMGADGVQLYAVEGEMAPENLTGAAIAEKRRILQDCGLEVSALCGDLGCSAGPWLTGLVSDAAQKSSAIVNWGAGMGNDPAQAGLKIGLLAAIAFPLVMFFGILYMRRQMKRAD